jgi:hypothetical protein
MQQPETLAELVAKLDEMESAVGRCFAPPLRHSKQVQEPDNVEQDSSFMDSIWSFFFGNRK